MGKFDDLVSSVGLSDDGVTLAYPETFMADAQSAHAEDLSIPVAKIAVLEAENAALVAEVSALKAHNYDLIMQVPATDDDGSLSTDDDTDDDGTDNDTTPDDLFGEDDDDEK